MDAFTPDQWLIVAARLRARPVPRHGADGRRQMEAPLPRGGTRRDGLEAENRRLRKDAAEMDTLRQAAARDEARRRVDGPGPL